MLDLVIDARRKDLGGFEVGRVLPFMRRRMVGPFIFFDHMGPVDLPPHVPRTTDVRPHPHIGLSTVTYLFDGEITHRDSTGAQQAIRPGAVNWMTAGSGISHSDMLLGGEPLGPRHIWWNFLSLRQDRIKQAKADWQNGRIHLPLNDDQEFIPLPEDPRPAPEPMS
ncbi:pirin family protein [Microvirga lotononidis]|uniref:pirin family protein n=1 Tax=Microvirga lotononidis TaxID=864069 RepID=UPI00058F6CE3|nr:pirin family protein [Microvirga lotononidis]